MNKEQNFKNFFWLTFFNWYHFFLVYNNSKIRRYKTMQTYYFIIAEHILRLITGALENSLYSVANTTNILMQMKLQLTFSFNPCMLLISIHNILEFLYIVKVKALRILPLLRISATVMNSSSLSSGWAIGIYDSKI